MAGRMPNILFVQTDQLTIDVLNAYHRPLALTPTRFMLPRSTKS